MNRKAVFSLVLISALLTAPLANAAETEVDRLLDLLVKKGIVTQDDAVGFRADLAVKKQEDPATYKVQVIPEWTQNVKLSGDVRYRTRGDWGKTSQNQPQTSAPTNANDLRKQRLQESIRGRFAIEAKVNDSTYAGARFAGGNTNSRSTDDTLTGYFQKANVMFDQYYMRFEAPKELTVKYGKYFSDLKLWAGKFGNPFEYSELVWDPDITPGGVVLQYVSPEIDLFGQTGVNGYANIGFVWVDESASFNTDPLLWVYQAGAKTGKFGPLDSTVNIGASIYDFANLKGKTPNANSAGTNSRTWIGDYGYGIGSSSLGTYKYEYNVVDLLVRIDNEKFGDQKAPHGFVLDFIYNASLGKNSENKGALLGGYVGKKKLKDVGDWKVSADWRYIERNAIPDFMPDNNFYGFGTYVNANTRPNVNGLPSAGGTNGRGFRAGFEYQFLKNSTLNTSLFWMEPIKSFDKRDPWTTFLFEVITKF